MSLFRGGHQVSEGLLYGPPGTGKTLLARAMAHNMTASFIKASLCQWFPSFPSRSKVETLHQVVASAIVDKYIGESARIIREMFGYAKEHQPCIIIMDEIDAIGGKRFSQGTSADREIQRTLMELLNHGLDDLGRVKIIMATNRPDTLDPALLRPGRLDRKDWSANRKGPVLLHQPYFSVPKHEVACGLALLCQIEIPLPNEQTRIEARGPGVISAQLGLRDRQVLKIHAHPITKHGDIDHEAICKLTDNFNNADMRNICTEAGMFAIRAERDYVVEEDFMKASRNLDWSL
ncbi:RPT4A [Symbiodinium sp. CCMP2592]|nr:RPT4A [Symbiodinium sp. CCMP2592]